MADYIRESGDWVSITVRVPRSAWLKYEADFPAWPLAIAAVRDQVYMALLRRSSDTSSRAAFERAGRTS